MGRAYQWLERTVCRPNRRYIRNEVRVETAMINYNFRDRSMVSAMVTEHETEKFMESKLPFAEETTYTIQRQNMVVKPVFREDCHNTFGEILLKLMQEEMDGNSMIALKK